MAEGRRVDGCWRVDIYTMGFFFLFFGVGLVFFLFF